MTPATTMAVAAGRAVAAPAEVGATMAVTTTVAATITAGPGVAATTTEKDAVGSGLRPGPLRFKATVEQGKEGRPLRDRCNAT